MEWRPGNEAHRLYDGEKYAASAGPSKHFPGKFWARSANQDKNTYVDTLEEAQALAVAFYRMSNN